MGENGKMGTGYFNSTTLILNMSNIEKHYTTNLNNANHMKYYYIIKK